MDFFGLRVWGGGFHSCSENFCLKLSVLHQKNTCFCPKLEFLYRDFCGGSGKLRLDVLVHQLSGDLLCQLQVDEDCTIELLKLLGLSFEKTSEEKERQGGLG